MRLNITRISPHDYGEYKCVSKNEMGIIRADFIVQGYILYYIVHYIYIYVYFSIQFLSDHNPYILRPLPELRDISVYGSVPPDMVSLEDLCPPQEDCPKCADPRYYFYSEKLTVLNAV